MMRITVYYDGKAVRESDYSEATVREITIGRAPGCLLRLDEATVSRLHAVILWKGSSWVIERKASFGAVRVNGEEVENAPLQGGEEITIGKFSLRTQIESGAQRAAPRQAPQPEPVDSGVFQADDDGRTRAINLSAVAMFRIDPGMANVAQYQLEKDLVVFGRASNCDVVLLEKKSSRKHFEVRKEGLTYYLKDLNSANGTYVNGKKITEVELVPGDEVRVGETLLKFSIENPQFFEKQNEFLPVPIEAEEASPDPYSLVSHDNQAAGPAADPMQDFNPAAAEPETKSLFVKLYRKYKALPVGRRYLVLLLILAGILFLFDDVEKGTKKPTAVAKQKVVRDAAGKPLRVYENLKKDRKDLVDKNYAELKEAFEQKNYNRVLERVTTILNFVDDYKETKFYEARAKQAIEQKEANDREQEQRLRQQRIREEVAALEQKGAPLYKSALEDAKVRNEVVALAQDIFSKDPSNRLAQEWLDGIKEKEADEARLREEAKKKAVQKQKAEQALLAVEKLFKQEKYLETIDQAESLKNGDWKEADYLQRIEDLQKRVVDKLSSLIDPLLQQAEEQRKPGGDLVKAKDLYLKILTIDPKHEGAIRGLESIRDILHLQAKRLYAEAILSESVSDLSEAKDKFIRCEKTAPEGDIYKQRCKNKLARYESFSTGDL